MAFDWPHCSLTEGVQQAGPLLKHTKVQTDIFDEGADACFDLSLSLGMVMFFNLFERHSKTHPVYTWTFEKTESPRKDKPTWGWLNWLMLACHWILACYTLVMTFSEHAELGKQRKKQIPAVILWNPFPWCLQLPHCKMIPAAPHPFLSLCHSPSQKHSARLTFPMPALCIQPQGWDPPSFQETSPFACNDSEIIPPYTKANIHKP